MEHKPVFLTEYSLARVLKLLALRLGLGDSYADAMAQTLIQVEPIHLKWSKFLTVNCAQCEFSPDKCEFLNPSQHIPGRSQEDIRNGTALGIETGRIRTCPLKVPINDDKQLP